MTKVSALEGYGAVAKLDVSSTVKAGRYQFQASAEKLILADVMQKLAPQPSHRLLDIGCGPGTLLVPLSYCVDEVVGLDHAGVIEVLRQRVHLANATLVAGSFPDADIPGDYDRIIAYSVIQCIPEFEGTVDFALKAAALLRPKGRLLIGDIPSADRKARVESGSDGEAMKAEWRTVVAGYAASAAEQDAGAGLSNVVSVGALTDEQLLALIGRLRGAGFDCWIMPQPPELPFGRTREDIVVMRP